VSAYEGAAAHDDNAQIRARELNVGVRLVSSGILFVFAAFVFAFLYLQALNTDGLWRPGNIHPTAEYGVVILVCVLGAAAVTDASRRRIGAGREGAWRGGVTLALVLALAAFVLQIVQFTTLSFHPYEGSYPSVFYGWNAVFLAFWLGGAYWIETMLARTLRAGSEPGVLDEVRTSADGSIIYLYTMAGIELVAFILLYLVK
jgi:heme/copper-type cytochrome/quinol oxidase subunit 3